MKHSSVVGLGMVAGLTLAAWAMQSPDAVEVKSLADADAAINALMQRVNTLEARLDLLEDRDIESSAIAATVAAAAPANAQVIVIESVETVKPDATIETRVRELANQADGLEQQASSFETASQSITIDQRNDGNDGSRAAARRQMDSLRQQSADARRLAKQKRNEIKELTEPKQIIRGWSGKRSVEIITERDLSSELAKLGLGSFITAQWTLVDVDDTLAVVKATNITKVARPANFVDRPGSGH